MSLRKKQTLEELIQENKKQILQDNGLMDQIEERMEQRIHASLKKRTQA